MDQELPYSILLEYRYHDFGGRFHHKKLGMVRQCERCSSIQQQTPTGRWKKVGVCSVRRWFSQERAAKMMAFLDQLPEDIQVFSHPSYTPHNRLIVLDADQGMVYEYDTETDGWAINVAMLGFPLSGLVPVEEPLRATVAQKLAYRKQENERQYREMNREQVG